MSMRKNFDNSELIKLKRKTFKGLSFMVVREFLLKAIAIVGQIALARALAPDIFGVFAILSFVVGLAEIFTDFGLSQVIIQSEERPEDDELTAIFFIKQGLTVLVVALIFVLGVFLPSLFHGLTPTHILMLKVMSLTLLCKPLRTVLISLLERDLRYVAIPKVDIAGMVTYYVVALLLVFFGLSLWGLIAAILVKELVELGLLIYFGRWFPRLSFRLGSVTHLLRSGTFFQLSVYVGVLRDSMIPLIAGTQLTPYAVGLLDWGDKIVSIPRAVTDNVGRISFSSFSRLQKNENLLSKACEKTIGMMTIMSLYLVLMVFPFGTQLVHYVLTDKWLPAVAPLDWLIVGVVFISGVSVIQQGVIAVGKMQQVFYYSSVIVLAQVALAFWLTSKIGYLGVAISTTVGFGVLFAAHLFYADRVGIHLKLQKIFPAKLLICLITLVLAFGLNRLIPNSFMFLGFKILLTSVVYGLLLIKFQLEEVKIIYSLLNSRENL